MKNLFAALALCLCAWAALAGPQEDRAAAAERGNAEAQYALGGNYEFGFGVPQSNAEAVKWYRKASDQGYAEAHLHLGLMYDLGQGVPQDYVEAHRWYNLAAARATDNKTRERASTQRERLAGMMTPAQVAEAQKLAREWKPAPPVK